MEEVERAVKAGDAVRIVAAADRYLAAASDPRVLQCKLVALTLSGHYEAALQAAADAATDGCVYERAYCLFRLQRYGEALQLLDSLDLSDVKATFRENELRAQTLYRLERFEECLTVYDKLLALKQDDYSVERSTNAMAAQAAAALSHVKMKLPSVAATVTATFEQSYNAACLDIAQGNYDMAVQRLDLAQKQCQEALKETPDITEEEIESELALLRVQQAVAHQLAGRHEQAAATLNRIFKKRPSDAALLAVISNNLVALNKDKDLFDSRKKMRNASSVEVERRLAAFQRQPIAMNSALLLLLLNQMDNCRQLCRELAQTYPQSDTPTLILAASHIRALGKKASVVQKLEAVAKLLGDDKLGKLVSAQILVDANELGKAAELLETVGQVRHQPAVVGYLVALYNKLNRSRDAERILTESLAFWQDKAQTEDDVLIKAKLLRACGELELMHRQYDPAVKHFGELVADQPEDSRALASLIVALSHVDLSRAEEYARTLPSASPTGAEALDVNELEQGKAIRTSKARKGGINFAKLAAGPPAAAAATAAGGGDSETAKKKRKKRKKKVRLPKNYVPGMVADPERWLPKWQRSGYANKHKRKQQTAVGKGTQGSANISAAEAASLDAANRPTVVKEAPKKPPGKSGKKGKRR